MENMDHVTSCMSCGTTLERGAVTLYKDNKPFEKICYDCEGDRDLTEYVKTGYLNTHFIMDNSMKLYYTDLKQVVFGERSGDREALRRHSSRVLAQLANLNLRTKIKEFETRVWFAGLQGAIVPSRERAFSAKPKTKDGFIVMTYCMAGRCMITFENKDSSVTAITADDMDSVSRMGLQGISATEEQATALIDRAIQMWEAGELEFKQDKKISII